MKTRSAIFSIGAASAMAAWCSPMVAAHWPEIADAFGVKRRLHMDGAVALTFDDGPDPLGTPAILDCLDANSVKATFFVVGEQVRNTGSLIDEVIAAGHTVAIHGDTHRNLARLTKRTLREDLDRAVELLGARAIAVHRPPCGNYSFNGLREIRRRGWLPLLWSRWGRDWQRSATPETIANDVAQSLDAGDVLLLHDSDRYSASGSWKATADALPRIIEMVYEQGMGFAPVCAPTIETTPLSLQQARLG